MLQPAISLTFWWKGSSISWQASTRLTTQTRVYLEIIALKMAVQEATGERKMTTSKANRLAWATTVRADLKPHLKRCLLIKEEEMLSTEETFQSRGASCTASTFTILGSQRSNTKPSSTCVGSNRSASISNQEEEQPLCFKTVSSQASWPWWLSLRIESKLWRWCAKHSNSSSSRQEQLASYPSLATRWTNPGLTK